MTLFRKVFSPQDAAEQAPNIRTSYDLAMAPEPDDLVSMDTLAEMIAQPDNSEPTKVEALPLDDAVAEAQSLLQEARNAPTSVHDTPPATSGRTKTRLLGFRPANELNCDPMEAHSLPALAQNTHPVGWLVVIDGPGTGNYFSLFSGVASIGRGAEQTIRLDFGDNAVSRENHAALAFDPEQCAFFLGHGAKSNLVRHNGTPVLSTEQLANGDTIRIGETTLKLVALCGEDFNWDAANA